MFHDMHCVLLHTVQAIIFRHQLSPDQRTLSVYLQKCISFIKILIVNKKDQVKYHLTKKLPYKSTCYLHCGQVYFFFFLTQHLASLLL